MKQVERKLASVKEVTDVKPIEGADLIEAVVVDNGWQVVERKGKVTVGELVVYAEPDSVIPNELAPFLSKGREPKEFNGVRGERLRTIKLKNTLSQGLILTRSDLPQSADTEVLIHGEDWTDRLGIVKWEAPIPACLAGQVRGNFPSWISRTDQWRAQNVVSEIFNDHKDERYEVTIKLDGSSCTIYVRDGDFGVCSRNLDLKETEGNSFWMAARSQGIIVALLQFHTETGRNIALQSELLGNGIQGNQEKIEGHRLFLFDIYDIDHRCYLRPGKRLDLLDVLVDRGADLEHTPIIDPSVWVADKFSSLDELLAYADGPSLNPQVRREGVVFKSHDSAFSFKAISNQWLLKAKD
jgi:hypothetical protein